MAVTSTQIQQLYVAYFARPADPVGLAFYISSAASSTAAGTSDATILDSISATFASSTEYTANFTGMSNAQIVNQVYQNLFSHPADATGLLYWAGKLTSGALTVSNIVRAISTSAVGAANVDGVAFDSKVSAAESFTAALTTTDQIIGYSGTAAGVLAKTYITSVNSAVTLATAIVPATLAATVANVVATGNYVAGSSFTLTTGTNIFTGSTGNDSFDGSLSSSIMTLTTGDSLSGGSGTDALIATITGSVTPTLLSSIESVTITNTAIATFGMANATGTTSLILQSGTGGETVTGIGKAVAVTLSDSAQNHTITYNDVTGSADSATVTLSNMTAGTQSLLGIETLSLVASGTSNVLTALTATQATSISISGSGSLDLGTALGTATLTVNASAATGILTMITGASTVGQTITGGSGNDVIFMGGTVADSINAGAGADTIIMIGSTLTAADTVAGGDGTDILVLSATADQTVADAQFTLVSSVERLSGGTLLQGNTASADIAVTANTLAKAAGIVRFSDAATGDSAYSLSIGTAYNATAVTYDFSSVADTVSFNATATGTTAVMTFQGDADGITAGDSLTGGTSSGDTLIFNSAGTTGTIAAGDIGGIEILNVTATNGAVTFITADTQITDSSTTALVVNASAATGASTFTFATATAHAITYTGSGLVDSVTAGAGNDSLSLGAGIDTAVFLSANFTTNDTVAGGDGNDILSISDAATLTDVKFTNVTSFETLTLANATNSVTLEALAMAAGIATVTGGTGADTIAVSATFTNPLRVTMDIGNDSVIVTGAAVLTAAVTGTGLTANDTITGGTTTSDVLRITADGTAPVVTLVSAVETYLIIGDAGAVSITTANANAATGTTLTIDGSSLASGTFALTVDANLETDAKIVVTGGSGADFVTLTTTGADSVSGGTGADTFTVTSAGFTLVDTIAGGAGTDIIVMSDTGAAVVDADFTLVTLVERLNSTSTTSANTLTATIGALAQAAGLVSIVGGTGVDTVTVGAGYTGTIRVTPTSGSDVISASATAGTLQIATALGDIDAADVWTGGTGASDALVVTTGTATAATLAQVTAFETITTSGDGGAFSITLADVNVASGVTMTVNGASLVTTNTLVLDGTAETNGKFSITGGSGADSLTGGTLGDTIDGGSGADVIDGGSGNDSMTGGAGNDSIVLGQAEDYADGGVGTDTLTITAIGSGAFVLDLSASTDQMATYNGSANATSQINFENATFTSITGTLSATAAAGGSTITSGSGSATLTGGAGNDSLTGGAAADSLVSAAGVDSLTGGAGNDRYTIALNSLGVMDDTIVDSAGTDTLVLTGAAPSSTSRVAVDLTAALFGSTVLDVVDLTGITTAGATVTVGTLNTTVLGTDFADSVTGGANIDTISTGAGNDTVTGAGSADVIDAGDGADTLVYLLTGDLFTGQAVVDSITGGSGVDILLAGTVGTAFAIANNDVWTRANTVETITSVANTAAVTIALDVTAETAGIRTVDISAAITATTNIVDVSEYVTAGVTITTGAVATSVIGGAGADTITGGAGADIISGNAGADSIVAGAGADRIYADNHGNKQTSTITMTRTGDMVSGETGTAVIDGVSIVVTLSVANVSGDGDADLLAFSTALTAAINTSASLVGIATATAALGVTTVTFQKDGVHTLTASDTAINATLATAVTATGTVGTGGLDIINLGAADAAIDKVFVGPAASTNSDTISNFTLGDNGDHLVVSLADTTNTAGIAGAATVANVFTLSSTTVNAANEIVVLVATTYSTAALAEAALTAYAGGTIGGDVSADVIFVYSNGTNSFVYRDLNAGTTTAADADLTLIATLTGLTSVGTMTSANFFFSN